MRAKSTNPIPPRSGRPTTETVSSIASTCAVQSPLGVLAVLQLGDGLDEALIVERSDPGVGGNDKVDLRALSRRTGPASDGEIGRCPDRQFSIVSRPAHDLS